MNVVLLRVLPRYLSKNFFVGSNNNYTQMENFYIVCVDTQKIIMTISKILPNDDINGLNMLSNRSS